jgi:hypothetical protein
MERSHELRWRKGFARLLIEDGTPLFVVDLDQGMSVVGHSRSVWASARSNHVRYTPTATGSSGALK